MSDDVFRSQPWFQDHSVIGDIPPGMLGPDEGSLLVHLARDYYQGRGEIIDAGAFLGASAWCLSSGLNANQNLSRKMEVLHSYDLFRIWQEPGSTDQEAARLIENHFGVKMAGYESTLGVVMKNLGDLARYVTVHQGDILKETWPGRPIEILFIDICKIEPIWKHVVGTFYRSLIPGVSVVVHQDWHHVLLPYLHIGQEAFADYFEVVVPKANDSAAFRLTSRIPDRLIDQVARMDFSPDEKLALMDSAIARFSGNARFLRVAKAKVLLDLGRIDEASSALHRAATAHGEKMMDHEQETFNGSMGAITASIENVGLALHTSFDEGGYLAANPDVARAVEVGIFDSGLRHWFRHGRWMGRTLK